MTHQVLPKISQSGIRSNAIKNHLLKDSVDEYASALSTAWNHALRDLERPKVLQAIRNEIHGATTSLPQRSESAVER